MENTKKEVIKDVSKKVDVKQFKESSKLTAKEIENFPKVLCRVEKNVSNKGREYFSITTRFDGNIGSYKLRSNLDENQYNHFIRKHKLDPNKAIYVCYLPVRFITGVGKNGNDYYSYQLFLSDVLTINNFLNRFDRSELNDLGYHIEYETRSDLVEVDLDVEW